MAQKTKIHKDRNFILWFLRLFPAYRKMEEDSNAWGQLAAELLEKNRDLRQKTESDSNLINSLNRFIAMLEGKVTYQADLIKDLKRRLKEINAKPKGKPRKKPDRINNVYKARPHGGQR